MTDYNKAIGEELRERRLRARLTAYQLGTKIGVSRALVNFWETNKRTISAQQLFDALDALNVEPSDFFRSVRERV